MQPPRLHRLCAAALIRGLGSCAGTRELAPELACWLDPGGGGSLSFPSLNLA